MSDTIMIHARHERTVRFYVVVYAALVVLTVLTWGLSRLHLGGGAGLIVALAIAVTKALLVMLFFMHLLAERGISRLVMLTAVVFVAVLIALTVADVATRFPGAVQREGSIPIAPPSPAWPGEATP